MVPYIKQAAYDAAETISTAIKLGKPLEARPYLKGAGARCTLVKEGASINDDTTAMST